jgi:monooxygenase
MEITETNVIIVGAGLTGIGASYYLAKNNIDHVLLEKSDTTGGVWSHQKWPGIRCDTDIIKYSYSFKPLLSEHCLVPGKTISNYLDDVSQEFGIRDRTVFGITVERAEFRSRENRWYVHTNKGVYCSRFLINANGYFLDAPHVPSFAGTDTFKGELLHLFHVDEHTSLKDRNIVLVGSGASAITAAPALCEHAASVTLLQRSPSYIYEEDNQIGPFVNLAQKFYRAGVRFPVQLVTYFMQLKDDLIFVMFRKLPWTGKLIFERHWKDTVDTDTYRTHFTPAYGPWEQRIPMAIGLKNAIRSGKLNIVTGEIDRFTESGIRLKNGASLKTDLCILATGFDLSFFKFDVLIDGEPVNTTDINFYKGMMMGGIPNYFQPFVAPHSSFTRRVEVVSRLVVKIIRYMQRHKLGAVCIKRKKVVKTPRITPNYVMRNLDQLPAIYGTFELPSIDSLLFFHFRKSNYTFSG